MSQSQLLTPKQTHALFDILTHHETYSEIEAFKSTDAVLTHGFPFRTKEQQARVAAAAARQDIAAPAPTSSGGGLTGFALSLWGRSSDSSAGATPTPSAPDSPRVYTPSSVAAEPPSSSSAGSDAEGGGDECVLDDADNAPSALPVMQLLTSTFVMRLPAVKALPRDFWAVRVQGLLSRLADADLSESYDKGAMGARKTLASGSGSVIEMIARGFLGGVARRGGVKPTEEELKRNTYDTRSGRELARAWEDVLDGLVYGDLVDAMFDYLAKTDQLEAHSAAVDAASSYVVLHLAALLHHVFVLSPDGPYLLKLLDGVHGLVPYRVIKQTLRVGNAATMISGMMRLLLAKLSVTGLTNWLGVTQSDDDGMNLLQNIISLVLSRDAGEFKKAVQRVDKAGDDEDAGGLSEAVRAAIREHVASDKTQQAAVRRASVEARESIVVAILRARGEAEGLSEAQHGRVLEYYSALLSMRDREAITGALCRHPPDLFTKAIKEAVAAYNPVIRAVHERVDLGAHLTDLQEFITQFIRVSTPANGGGGAPTVTVEDYVKLLNDHKPLLHRFVHAVAKNCPDVWRDLRAWSNASIARFRQEMAGGDDGTRSAMDEALDGLVAGLSGEARTAVLAAVDEHAEYLAALKEGSDARLAQLAAGNSSGGGECWGPGVYLARWQDILDDTLITPDGGTGGKPRRGAEVRHLATLGKTGLAGGEIAAARRRVEPRAPDVGAVVKELGEQFGALMQAVNMERRVFGKN
ncbi:hypothetical protein ISF_01070 [Cordyceps fumosorosea ARSEF 2679]|uniref:Px domain containing protein n=1 Tax=Cordyceps fumosorosea (strain ARSEF 2679) TaxID=1081104 RepID=A0A162N1X1_CORFA|nr:hypothetical protein ISF_01070 [Cordyceps fumosorosea ARSEF 2679]OAA74169.1 hypothetical protein ISF_01070 [Cordyceps fumosorosea ARSEF 2679]